MFQHFYDSDRMSGRLVLGIPIDDQNLLNQQFLGMRILYVQMVCHKITVQIWTIVLQHRISAFVYLFMRSHITVTINSVSLLRCFYWCFYLKRDHL